MTLSPRSEALALRIYNHCVPLEWDCTHADVADALGEDVRRVGNVCRNKGWNQRLRVTSKSTSSRREYAINAHDLRRLV
jgi:hypothetical protein